MPVTNPPERLNAEIKRTDVVGSFPNESLSRAWSVRFCFEQNDEWQLQLAVCCDVVLPSFDQRELLGQMLESFVYGEIAKQAAAHPERIALYHLRDKDGYEVDIVLQLGTRYAGIEIKAASSVGERDFRGLKRLREILGAQVPQRNRAVRR